MAFAVKYQVFLSLPGRLTCRIPLSFARCSPLLSVVKQAGILDDSSNLRNRLLPAVPGVRVWQDRVGPLNYLAPTHDPNAF